jgi:hypothetical protein
VSIIGPSGSGKSTLMNIVGCLDLADEGEYYLDGIEIRKYSEDRLAEVRSKKIGFIFQNFNLIGRMSAWDNVELPLIYQRVPAQQRKERVEEARADLERCKDQLKKTEETSEEYRSQINDAIEKYRQWVRELKDTITKENPQDEFPTMKTLRDFAQICIDESPNGKQRKLWLKDGDNMKTVTAILFDGKKAVMEVGEPTTIIAPVPRYY